MKIGSRARVLGRDGDWLILAVDSRGREAVVACRRGLVARAERFRVARRRVTRAERHGHAATSPSS